MPEQLGKIERLEAGQFKSKKKLYLVPLLYASGEAPDDYKQKFSRYWQQVEEHLAKLESRIGKVSRVYHESIFQCGEDGMKGIERLNANSYQIVKARCDNGASLEIIEERELLEEVMDWQRCLMLGFISAKVASTVSQSYMEAAKKRNELIVKKINDTLKDNEAGLLFIREEHSLQFPSDIEVFSIYPPALDEIHRWQRDQALVGMEKHANKEEGKTEGRSEERSEE